tara:strand:+ start:181 stop:558 length:378 start_codon:yes stop_codon:yes gene_type:complete
MNDSQVRLLFKVSAVFNWAAAVILFWVSGIAVDLGMQPVPNGNAYELIGVLAIAMFGLGYWWVGENPKENISIVKLGLISKLLVVIVVYSCFFAGTANLNLAILVSGDLVFAALFGKFLADVKRF